MWGWRWWGARSTDGDCTAFPAWLVERTKRALHAKHGIYGYLWWISIAKLVKRSPIFRIYGYLFIYVYIYIYIYTYTYIWNEAGFSARKPLSCPLHVHHETRTVPKGRAKKIYIWIFMDIYGYLWIFMVDLSKYLGFSIDVPGMYFFPDWLLETWSKKRRVSGEARKTIGFPRCFPRAIIGVGNHGFYQRNHVGNHGFSHFWMGFPTWFLW